MGTGRANSALVQFFTAWILSLKPGDINRQTYTNLHLPHKNQYMLME